MTGLVEQKEGGGRGEGGERSDRERKRERGRLVGH